METENDSSFTCALNMRSNTEIELAVNRGLAAALLHGEAEGIKIMMEEGVPYEIILRVLNNDSNRRSSDWKSCSSS
jgi:hypothetical protein